MRCQSWFPKYLRYRLVRYVVAEDSPKPKSDALKPKSDELGYVSVVEHTDLSGHGHSSFR